MLLEGKVAIITGASRGIGKAIAHEFVQQGATVAFTYHSSEEKARALEKELAQTGGNVKGFKSDAAQMDQAEVLVKDVVEAFGTVDIVVNNAGITDDTLLMRMNEEQWDRVINVNLKSCFALTKAVMRTMLKARAGSIIQGVRGERFAPARWAVNRTESHCMRAYGGPACASGLAKAAPLPSGSGSSIPSPAGGLRVVGLSFNGLLGLDHALRM